MLGDDFPVMLEREAGMSDNIPAVAVAFGNYPQEDPHKSAEAGHAVFKDTVFIKIAVPGDKNSLYFQPATDRHKERFPKAWDAYQKRERGGSHEEGMPLEHWAVVTRGVAMTLKAAHIYTVEALAEVHDGHIDQIGIDGRGLREKARAFLAQARDNAATMKLASEKKELQDQLVAMQEQIKALQAQQSDKSTKKQAA